MSRVRFQSTGKTSFYGDYLYERVVPRGDFLRMLKGVVPWDRFTHRLIRYYRGKGQAGRPPGARKGLWRKSDWPGGNILATE